MSNLSDLLPAGGGQNAEKFTATGTLPSGQAVVLNSDGTVSAVTGTVTSKGIGARVTVNPSTSGDISAVYDTVNDKVVVVYHDGGDSYKGKAIVGTISGTSISFGTEVEFASNPDHTSAAYDVGSGKVIIGYADDNNSEKGTAIVGTVSGTSISFGSSVVFNNAAVQFVNVSYNAVGGKPVFHYMAEQLSAYGAGIVGTVSGTSISFGSLTVFNSSTTSEISATFSETIETCLVAYKDAGGGAHGEVVAGLVSGTSISYGSSVTFKSSSIDRTETGYDPDEAKWVVCFRDETNSDYGTSFVASISGNTVSIGSLVVFQASTVQDTVLVYDRNVKKMVLFLRNVSNASYVWSTTGTISGTSITWDTASLLLSRGYINTSGFYDPDTNQIFFCGLDTNVNQAQAFMYTNAYTVTNNTNLLGITAEGISNGATGSVNLLGGINEAQSGLTIASDYYVQYDGSLNTATSAVNYDIANASYTQAFSVASQETFPSGIAFNTDGTKMFITGNTGNDINEYTLSTAYDVSSAVFVDSFDVSAKQAAVMGVAFNTDGTKMFIVGETEDTVAQYALSTGFDVSSAVFTQTFSIASQETEAQSITFNNDGTKMFIVGDTGNDISEYTLSIGFDVSSALFVDSFSLASQTTQPKEGVFNTDGTELYVLGRDNGNVFKYTLTTGFDVSTALYASVEFSVSSHETSPQGLAFNADGSKMYVCGDTGQDVNQYATTSTATNSTTVLAGQAISATTINMRNLT